MSQATKWHIYQAYEECIIIKLVLAVTQERKLMKNHIILSIKQLLSLVIRYVFYKCELPPGYLIYLKSATKTFHFVIHGRTHSHTYPCWVALNVRSSLLIQRDHFRNNILLISKIYRTNGPLDMEFGFLYLVGHLASQKCLPTEPK